MTEENQAIAIVERPALPALAAMDVLAVMSDEEFDKRLAAMKTAQRRVATVQREMMQEHVDYGRVEGIDKPILMKSGAEKLCKMYNLVPTFDSRCELGDGITSPHIRWLSTCHLHVGTDEGPVVATGHGNCNSWEKKYRYRYAERSCPTCGKAGGIIKGKAEYGGGWLCFAKRGGCGAKFGDNDPAITQQPLGTVDNPDPYDLDNTIQKMGDKRAYVDASLRGTATSGLFTQDLEEEQESPPARATEPPKPQPKPAPKPQLRPVPPVDDEPPPYDASPPPAAGFAEVDTMPTKRNGAAYEKPELIELIHGWQQKCEQAGVNYPGYPGNQQPMAMSELDLMNYGRRLRWLYEQAQQGGQ